MLGGHDPHIHRKRLAHVPSYNFHSYPFTNSRYKGWASRVVQEATEGQTVQSSPHFRHYSLEIHFNIILPTIPSCTAWSLPLMFSA